jgi:VIT1/CCC1 family predicted Fe2+/Mn2+ transporter
MYGMSELVARLAGRMSAADEERYMLQRVQPALIGLIDGTVSTLAPIFAAAFLAGPRAALFVGLAAALGAGISMGLSEALSDDGTVTGRGSSMSRGVITGGATFFGGSFHALPFLISDLHTALLVASFTVGCELIGIAWIRKQFLDVSWSSSLIQVTVGGVIVAITGALIGQA